MDGSNATRGSDQVGMLTLVFVGLAYVSNAQLVLAPRVS